VSARRWAEPAAALFPLLAIALVSGGVGAALVLVMAGAAVLWPALARFGSGVGVATLLALVYATPAYDIALGGGWRLAAGAALARSGLGASAPGLRGLWRAAAAAAAVIAAAAMRAAGAGPGAIADGLFSSWSGLLFWSPAAWLGLAGLAGLGRRLPSRALAPALLCAAALAADLGPVRGGRFAPVLPLLGLGLAWTLAALRDACARRPLVPVAVAVGAFAAWNFLLMAQYRGGGVPRDDTVAFDRVARNAAASVSAAVGSPTAWPASWVYSARHGVAPARYDLLGGVDLFEGPVALGGVIDVGDSATDAALLEGGWSVRHACGVEVCREVEGEATLVVPVGSPREADLEVAAAGDGMLDLSLNGVPVMSAALDDALLPRRARIPGGRFRRGLNRVVLRVAPGGRALVDRITLSPVAPAP
jgi:hypothetical protein